MSWWFEPRGGRSAFARGERFVAECLVLVVGWLISGLILALIGLFHWIPVVLLTLAGWLVVRRFLPESTKSFDLGWVTALTIALGLGLLNGAHPGEHLLTGRDAATYLATASWLATQGTLYVDAKEGPLGEVEEAQFAAPGFYDRGGDRPLEPQFMHAFPAIVATLIAVGGVELGLVSNAVLGSLLLLALFGLARRFLSPWWALVSMATLGFSLVFLYYARSPFSEPLMGLLIVGGIWLLGLAEERQDTTLGLIAGVLLGAATMVRLDGIVLLIPVTAYLLLRGGGPGASKTVPWVRRARHGMNVTALLGITESLLVAPAYVLDRSGMVTPVLIAILLIYVAHDVLKRTNHIRTWGSRNKGSMYVALVVSSALLLGYGWMVRPMVAETSGSSYDIVEIQEREGLEVEPGRTYAEWSVRWLTWYQGAAFVLLAFLGAVLLLRRDWFDSIPRPGWLLVAIFATFAMLYLWRPRINPDQIWAMRRYLPVVLPLGALMAGVSASGITRRLANWSQPMRWVSGALLSGVLLLPPLVVTAPLWDLAELDGLADDYEALCDRLNPEDSVLLIDPDNTVSSAVTQGLRSYCGVSAAWTDQVLSDERLHDLERTVSAQGGRLVLATPASDIASASLVGPYSFLERTLSTVPTQERLTSAAIHLELAESGSE